MKNALTGRPNEFAKWVGLSVSLILAAMAALIFLVRVVGHSTGARGGENSMPGAIHGDAANLDSTAPGPKRFKF